MHVGSVLVASSVALGAMLVLGNAANARYQSVYSFQGGSDGYSPTSGLTEVGGMLYGTTPLGGGGVCSGYCGTVFALNTNTYVETPLYSFKGGSDGGNSVATLLNNGNLLYGTTTAGGGSQFCSGGCGTTFSVNLKTGAETTLYSFHGGTDGSVPAGTLVKIGPSLYGTTVSGGGGDCGNSCGIVFAVNRKTGVENVAWFFQGYNGDGENPVAGLIDVKGILYGTTPNGGTMGEGVVFSLNRSTGAETVLYSFQGEIDGANPYGGLLNYRGTLYGTTAYGGAYGKGTVFSLNPQTQVETVLHSFQGGDDGANPWANLLEIDGILYGTTSWGGGGLCPQGPGGCGTVFSWNLKTGIEKVRYSFRGGSDGAFPTAGLIDVAGTLYGTTQEGGNATCAEESYGCGTVFAITP